MTKAKRRGSEQSATRALIIDAAENLMIEEGYASVTARRLGARAGLKSMLLHYYFDDMDELFISVIRRRAQVELERMVKVLAGDQPLRLVWNYEHDERNARLYIEYLALAAHRPAVRREVKHFGDQQMTLQSAAIAKHFELLGVTPSVPPTVLALLLTSLSQSISLQSIYDITMGHEGLKAWVNSWIASADNGSLASFGLVAGVLPGPASKLDKTAAQGKRRAAPAPAEPNEANSSKSITRRRRSTVKE